MLDIGSGKGRLLEHCYLSETIDIYGNAESQIYLQNKCKAQHKDDHLSSFCIHE